MTNPQTAYREINGQGATAVRLVVLLYEQIIQDLTQAAQAIEENNTELRTNRINHALDVICLLQGTLNMEVGGQVARNLVRFYETLRANLWEAQLQVSKQALSRQITDVLTYGMRGPKSTEPRPQSQSRNLFRWKSLSPTPALISSMYLPIGRPDVECRHRGPAHCQR